MDTVNPILKSKNFSNSNKLLTITSSVKNNTDTYRQGYKKNKSVSLNLIEKFDDARGEKKVNLKSYFNHLMNSNKKNPFFKHKSKSNLSKEEVFNEIINKVNFYKQKINFKEELNKVYIQEVQMFIDYFLTMFNQVKNWNGGNYNSEMMKLSLERIEQLVFSNMRLLDFEESLLSEENKEHPLIEEKQTFLNILDNLFTCLQTSVEEGETGKLAEMSSKIKSMIEKMNDIKTCVLKSEMNLPEEIINNNESNFELLSNKKIKQAKRRSQNLLDTAYMKKSKAKYGEDDEVLIEEDFISKDNTKFNSIVYKTKKLFLRNFLQIFLMKDNGIFSESSFSKIDKSLLSAYKSFKFYEIKFYFSFEESFKDLTFYLKYFRKLFTRHIILYREDKTKKFTKITVCGVGKKQSLMKRNLINFMSGEVKLDCLIKMSLFSNIFDCMTDSLKKLNRKKNYYFFTNFTNGVLSKIISKIKQ